MLSTPNSTTAVCAIRSLAAPWQTRTKNATGASSDFAQVLIQQALTLYSDEPFEVELEKDAYALDSTTIDLYLSHFPWAKFLRHKAAIKLHTLLNLRGNFPTVIIVSTGKVYDVNISDQLSF